MFIQAKIDLIKIFFEMIKINVTHTTIFCDIFLLKLLIKVEEKQKD